MARFRDDHVEDGDGFVMQGHGAQRLSVVFDVAEMHRAFPCRHRQPLLPGDERSIRKRHRKVLRFHLVEEGAADFTRCHHQPQFALLLPDTARHQLRVHQQRSIERRLREEMRNHERDQRSRQPGSRQGQHHVAQQAPGQCRRRCAHCSASSR